MPPLRHVEGALLSQYLFAHGRQLPRRHALQKVRDFAEGVELRPRVVEALQGHPRRREDAADALGGSRVVGEAPLEDRHRVVDAPHEALPHLRRRRSVGRVVGLAGRGVDAATEAELLDELVGHGGVQGVVLDIRTVPAVLQLPRRDLGVVQPVVLVLLAQQLAVDARGIGALGYTIQRPTEDRFLMTREELENKIAVLLGGRAAEKIVYDHLSTGAADDLVKATDIARAMVARYGMDPDLGHVSYDNERPGFLGTGDQSAWLNRRHSEATAERMDVAVKAIIDDIFARTVALLEANRALLEETSRDLLDRETLDEPDLRAIAEQVRAKKGEAA